MAGGVIKRVVVERVVRTVREGEVKQRSGARWWVCQRQGRRVEGTANSEKEAGGEGARQKCQNCQSPCLSRQARRREEIRTPSRAEASAKAGQGDGTPSSARQRCASADCRQVPKPASTWYQPTAARQLERGRRGGAGEESQVPYAKCHSACKTARPGETRPGWPEPPLLSTGSRGN